MDDELDYYTELAACIQSGIIALETARDHVLPRVAAAEQRHDARIRKARQRLNAPTTHTKTDAPLTRSA